MAWDYRTVNPGFDHYSGYSSGFEQLFSGIKLAREKRRKMQSIFFLAFEIITL
jgi:hypothetical protein